MESNVPHVYLLGKTYLTNNEAFYIRNDSILHMAAGDRHTIIVTESGRTYAFGDNSSGQLGLGHIDATEKVLCIKSLKFDGTGEKIILAACGRESSLVATNRGSLYVFGSNYRCQLGIESEEFTNIHSYPVKIEHFHSKISWKQVSMGAEHTCALTNNGEVYGWGSNEYGQCGLTRKYDMIRTPTELRLEYLVTAISCGYYHTALISEDGRLFLFGNNSDRQLERSISDQYIGPLEVSLPDPIKAVACGNQHTVVLTKKGEVYTCGRGDRGQLGLGRKVSITKHFEIIENLPKHLTAIAAGEGHTAIIDSHGNIYVFGDSEYGKLSSEIHSNEFEPYFIDKFKEHKVLNVVCGGCQTIILAEKKSIKNKEDIENTISSKTKSIETICYINHNLMTTNRTNTIDETLNNNLSLHSDSIFDPDKLLVSMKNAFMGITHVEINRKLQSTKTSLKFDLTTDENNLSSKQSSDDEISSSKERSFVTFEQNLLDENDHQYDYQISPSSTTSGRTSSSISSVENENTIITSESNGDFQSNCYSSTAKTHILNSNIDSTKKSQSGIFSRIFGTKSSQNLLIDTHQNSKTCAIM